MIARDLRFAFRQLTKSPGYALAVMLTLALGIGVNTAVFSMVDGFLLRSLPFREPERVGALILHQQGVDSRSGKFEMGDNDTHTGATWQALRGNLKLVTMASWGGSDGVNLQTDAASGGVIRYVHESRVSADYFDVLGIPLYRGRSFTANEDRPNGPKAVVLSDVLWRSTFRADPNVVGEAIHLKGEPYTVVGVLPPGAVTPSKADLFTPLQPAPTGECGGDNCGILLRLKPGATWAQENAELGNIRLPMMDEASKRSRGAAWFYAQPLAGYLSADMRPQVEVLMLAVSFILVIACANLAGLALVRIARRTREIATRLALGATRVEVLRQLWVENLVLAMLGAAVGVALAVGILRSLSGFLPESMLPMGGFALNARVLIFAFAASLATSLLFGALPALTTRRVDLRSSMSGSYSVAGGSGRVRQWLIGAEVALTVVLLAAAGLLLRTLIHLETLPPGFDARNVMTAKASLDDARYHDAAAFQGLLAKSVAAMRRIPGVEDAAVGLSAPYDRGLNDGIVIMDGEQSGKQAGSSLSYVTPGYFSTLRIPLLAGRSIADGNTSTSQPVVVVNEDFAQKFFHEPAPIGRHFKLDEGHDGFLFTIVGVVGNVTKRPGMERGAPIATEPVFYLPVTQTPQGLVNVAHIWFQPSWIVRTSGPVAGLTESMQKALAEVDPLLPFSGFYSMDEILAQQLQQQRIEVLLFTTLAGLALLLSAIGIYALVSNLVVQRTREIGIRIALGSTIGQAMVEVGSSGAIAACVGLVAGIALSLVAVRVLSSEIYGVRTYDPVTFVAVPALLALIAAVASFLPTLRIVRIEPAETLRAE